MENNRTNKKKFQAQYYGQKVFCVSESAKVCQDTEAYFIERFTDTSYLQLRSLESITDEEKIEVAKLVCARHNRHYQPEEINYSIKSSFEVYLEVKGIKRFVIQICHDGIGFVDVHIQGYGEQHYYAPGQYSTTDYLRSIGILIPFMDLSVERIIEYGWAKILN